MQKNKISVLFVCVDWYEIGGSTGSLIDLINCMEGLISPIVLVSHEGKVSERLRQLGIRVIIHPFFYLWDKPKKIKTILHHPKKSTIYRYLTVNRQCTKKTIDDLNGTQIDIVHSNSSITTVGVRLAKLLKAKHIWHIREFIDLDFGLKVYGGRQRLKRIIEHADARVCVSSAISEHWHFTIKNTNILWDAVNTIKTDIPLISKEPYFLFCAANINKKKGVETAVEAFCMSHLAENGYHLKIVGHCSDDYRSKLTYIASQYQQAHFLTFIDYIDHPEKLFAKATAFLMCSYCEAMGRVSVQAMQLRCPVIARNTGGTTDFIHHNKTGLLFSTSSECAYLMQDILKRNISSIIDQAETFAKTEFSPQKYRIKLYSIYQTLIQL